MMSPSLAERTTLNFQILLATDLNNIKLLTNSTITITRMDICRFGSNKQNVIQAGSEANHCSINWLHNGVHCNFVLGKTKRMPKERQITVSLNRKK